MCAVLCRTKGRPPQRLCLLSLSVCAPEDPVRRRLGGFEAVAAFEAAATLARTLRLRWREEKQRLVPVRALARGS